MCPKNLSGLFKGHDPTRGSGQGGLKSRGSGRVGSGHNVLKSHGSGRIGSRGKNTASRVRSGQKVSKISRIGSSHDPRDTSQSQVKPIVIRELFTADPRVKPADLARGSTFFELTAEGRRRAGAPRVGPEDP